MWLNHASTFHAFDMKVQFYVILDSCKEIIEKLNTVYMGLFHVHWARFRI